MAGTSERLKEQLARSRGTASEFPDSIAAYDAVIAAQNGGVWAQLYSYPPDSASSWDVFDATGIHEGTVKLRPRFKPFQVGTDFILGVWRDSPDLEHVQLFGLVRSGRK